MAALFLAPLSRCRGLSVRRARYVVCLFGLFPVIRSFAALPDVLSGFYRRNSGLGFGDRSLGLGGLRRCCRRSGRFGSRRFLRSSGLRELYRRLFRYSREDFRRRGSRCIRCFRIACRIAVRYVDALFLHTELDGINIFPVVIAEFLCRNRPYRDRGDGYSLRSGQVFDDRAVAADENFSSCPTAWSP